MIVLLAAAAFTPASTVRSAQATATVRILSAAQVHLAAEPNGGANRDQSIAKRRTRMVIDGVERPVNLVEFN